MKHYVQQDTLSSTEGIDAQSPAKEWTCPRCGYKNSHKNECCMAAEMGDGQCGTLNRKK